MGILGSVRKGEDMVDGDLPPELRPPEFVPLDALPSPDSQYVQPGSSGLCFDILEKILEFVDESSIAFAFFLLCQRSYEHFTATNPSSLFHVRFHLRSTTLPSQPAAFVGILALRLFRDNFDADIRQGCDLSDAFPNLTRLFLSSGSATGTHFRDRHLLPFCSRLTHLEIEGRLDLTNECVSSCSVLKHLKIWRYNDYLNDEALQGLSELEYLDLESRVFTNRALVNKPKLRHLVMDNCAITDDVFKNPLPSLKILELSRCPQITLDAFEGKGIRLLALDSVTLSGCSSELTERKVHYAIRGAAIRDSLIEFLDDDDDDDEDDDSHRSSGGSSPDVRPLSVVIKNEKGEPEKQVRVVEGESEVVLAREEEEEGGKIEIVVEEIESEEEEISEEESLLIDSEETEEIDSVEGEDGEAEKEEEEDGFDESEEGEEEEDSDEFVEEEEEEDNI